VTLLASPNYGLNRPQMALAALGLSLADLTRRDDEPRTRAFVGKPYTPRRRDVPGCVTASLLPRLRENICETIRRSDRYRRDNYGYR